MSFDDSLRFLESIYGPFGAHAGVAEDELAAAEARLGVSLPAALRRLYRATGKSAALHAVHNRLLPANDVDFANDHLVFYEENQSVVVWGIARSRLGDADPPVEQGPQPTNGEWKFFPEFRSVSEFACAQGAWQAVQGGLPFVGVREHRPSKGDLGKVLGPPVFANEGMRAWLVDRGIAVQAGDDYVGLATWSEETFILASKNLGIDIDDWDYATVRDE